MALKTEGQEMYPAALFSPSVLVSSLHQSGGAWYACAQQTEKSHSHTTFAVSCQVYVHVLLVRHLQGVFFQQWFGMVQHQKQDERIQKNLSK